MEGVPRGPPPNSAPLVVRPPPSRWAASAPVRLPRPRAHRRPRSLATSITTEVLLESILGWKEYELELMRDKADNVVVVCSIEGIDPVGVHTGDSMSLRR